MADTVTSQTLQDGDRIAVMKFTNISDGTGESDVVKVDVSALAPSNGKPCTGVRVRKINFSVTGMKVRLEYDATADTLICDLPSDSAGELRFDEEGGIPNNAGSGKTGDILFTTLGQISGDSYMVTLTLEKTYG